MYCNICNLMMFQSVDSSIRCQWCTGELDYLSYHPAVTPSSVTRDQVADLRSVALEAACAAAEEPATRDHHMRVVEICTDALTELDGVRAGTTALQEVTRRINLRALADLRSAIHEAVIEFFTGGGTAPCTYRRIMTADQVMSWARQVPMISIAERDRMLRELAAAIASGSGEGSAGTFTHGTAIGSPCVTWRLRVQQNAQPSAPR